MKVPLPCIVCGKELEHVFKTKRHQSSPNQPSGGTTFSSHGHYGSTVWDPMSMDGLETLEINICDECLLAAGRAQRVLHVDRIRHPDTYKTEPWDPTEDHHDQDDRGA